MITVTAFSHADWFITWTINICALRAVGKVYVCVCPYIHYTYSMFYVLFSRWLCILQRNLSASLPRGVQKYDWIWLCCSSGRGWSIWYKAWEPFTRLLQKLWSALGTQNAREKLPSGFAGWPASEGSVLTGAQPLSQLWGAILQEPGDWLQELGGIFLPWLVWCRLGWSARPAATLVQEAVERIKLHLGSLALYPS